MAQALEKTMTTNEEKNDVQGSARNQADGYLGEADETETENETSTEAVEGSSNDQADGFF